jgi:ecdysone receptor
MMLRTARRYDPETNTVVFGDGQPFSQTCMAFGGLQDFVDLMFDFSRGMASIGVDNAEYALLTALCIFSGRKVIDDD